MMMPEITIGMTNTARSPVRNRIREVEEGRILSEAEVGCQEEFLGHDDLGPLRGGITDQCFVMRKGFPFAREAFRLKQCESRHAPNLNGALTKVQRGFFAGIRVGGPLR